MLTIYNKQSGFKKKFTVVTIWLIAIGMFSALINFLIHTEISMAILTVPAFLSFVVIAAILLRCKVGRAFTLVGVYLMMFSLFYPLVIGSSESLNLIQVITFIPLGILALYVFSNEKAMDLYYIESNPKEHLFYAFAAIGIIGIYYYFT